MTRQTSFTMGEGWHERTLCLLLTCALDMGGGGWRGAQLELAPFSKVDLTSDLDPALLFPAHDERTGQGSARRHSVILQRPQDLDGEDRDQVRCCRRSALDPVLHLPLTCGPTVRRFAPLKGSLSLLRSHSRSRTDVRPPSAQSPGTVSCPRRTEIPHARTLKLVHPFRTSPDGSRCGLPFPLPARARHTHASDRLEAPHAVALWSTLLPCVPLPPPSFIAVLMLCVQDLRRRLLLHLVCPPLFVIRDRR